MFAVVVVLLSRCVAHGFTQSAPARSGPLGATMFEGVVDEAKLFEESTFEIKPDALIERAVEVLRLGTGTKDDGACLAENFEFIAAVVGPLGKDEYLNALRSFKLEDSFDMTDNFHLFRVDPFMPNRVYFHSRTVATQIAPLMGKPSTGRTLTLPPQCFHMDFDAVGGLVEFGFYVVDRRIGNTGGLGGAFAFFYGTGNPLPIPECQPFSPSWRFRLFNAAGRLARKLQKK
ncbi:hypothetical protein M885DRAFT_433110 [Pelagophyceae sp. CCMP2097]|nr:hypothetical protein M885DRAFT_433110 [Pelagophyceae sp. CCMP2097]